MAVLRLLALLGFSVLAFAAAAAPAAFVQVLGDRALVAPATVAPGDPQIERLLTTQDDLWERIRAGFALPERRGRTIDAAEAWYAARPELVRAMLARAQLYLHYIVEEIERRGLPTELALLPLVESGFNPMAVSPAQAAGLWQFIPATASRYSLPQDRTYDARRDVIASTGAALDYLQSLHAMYGDWELALAAYNWGEMAVGRAVTLSRARGGDGSFASLTLPEETRNYVPRLQAVKSLIADPPRFGIELAKLSNEPYFTVVRLEKPLSLAAAAGFAGMPLDELVALNPGWSAPHSAEMRDVALVLPVDRTAGFQARYASWLSSRPASRKPVRRAP